MKTIHLLRHAKSSWDDATLDDIDRPLNARGIRTAKLMAAQLVKAGCTFTHVFCSPAVRAQSTISLINAQLPALKLTWKTDPALYTFDSERLHHWLQALDESINEVFIIGHNPALTNFCNALSKSDITNIPTCGYIQLVATETCTWAQASSTLFKMNTFLRPKALIIY